MFIKAELHIDSKVYTLLEFSHHYTQPINKVHRPIGNMQGGFWQISLEATQDMTFTEWAAHPTMLKNVKIVVYPATFGKSYTFALYDVFCVSNTTHFHHSSTEPVQTHLVFSPAQIAINGEMQFQKLWKVTDVLNQVVATSIAEEEEEEEEVVTEGYLPKITFSL